MPLIFTQQLAHGSLGLWKIEEQLHLLEEGIEYRSTAALMEKRLQQTAARRVLKHLYPAFPFLDVIVEDGMKPRLPDNLPDFSISHTSNFAAAILGNPPGKVGVDIEPESAKALRVSAKFMNDQEFISMRESSGFSQESFATLIWSIKETVYKWWGRRGVDFATMIRVVDFEKVDQGTAKVIFLPAGRELQVQFMRHGNLWITHLYALA